VMRFALTKFSRKKDQTSWFSCMQVNLHVLGNQWRQLT
jgi:hypothetical protein